MDVLIADEGLNARTLMGAIKHVCMVIFPQAVDIQVQAAYFPFAEISVNIWVVYVDGTIHEVGSSGLMRPEIGCNIRYPKPCRTHRFQCEHSCSYLEQ